MAAGADALMAAVALPLTVVGITGGFAPEFDFAVGLGLAGAAVVGVGVGVGVVGAFVGVGIGMAKR